MSEAFDEAGLVTETRSKKQRAKVTSLKKSKPVARARQSSEPSVLPSPWKGMRLGLLLLTLCIVFGVQSAYQSQRMRALYSELQQDQVTQDALLAQRSRLLIERGAMSSYNGTEKIAAEELGMRFPERIVRLPNSDDSAPDADRNSGVRGQR
jgi:cell division protein FtsL